MAAPKKSAAAVSPKQIDIKEFHRMVEKGVLPKEDPGELVNGEIAQPYSVTARQTLCANGLSKLLRSSLRDAAEIGARHCVALGDHTELCPDIVLLKPRSKDVLLVIEVAEASIEYDRAVKLPFYARAGIPETWIVGLNSDILEQFSTPRNGHYYASKEFRRGEKIASVSIPSLSLAVNEILG